MGVRPIVLVVIALAAVGCASDDGTPASSSGASVVRVIDGDTFDVRLDGREERVRLVGINTPEREECFYDEATEGLEVLIRGQSVRLERDESDRDQYGRLLRYVYVGDTFVNEAMVEDGLAISRAYPPDTAEQDGLDRAQDEARAAERGLWAPAACGPAARGAEGLTIRSIQADPPGDDTLVLNGEYVVVANEGSDAVSLAGWVLRDESSTHRFTFPDLDLPPGETVNVHSGCSTPTDADLFWCVSGSAIWNNDGDTAFLIDPAGNVATSRSYP